MHICARVLLGTKDKKRENRRGSRRSPRGVSTAFPVLFSGAGRRRNAAKADLAEINSRKAEEAEEERARTP